ncbi:hypothetical protein ScPMuIL_002653 [Solemya velum]
MSEDGLVRVGSRKSQLAMIQTNSIIDALKSLCPDKNFEVVSMTTTGDKILDSALSKIGEKSLFTRELEVALLNKEVDFVVHSLKDLPTLLPDGLIIGCVYKRDSPFDAVVMHPKHAGKTLDDLPDGSVIGTSSLRRAAQLARKYPTFKFENIRGNLNTRLKKLDDADIYDAIILAVAGLDRMGWQNRISQVLGKDVCMYAVSQGAMAVECRADDKKTLELISKIHHQETALACIAERGFLRCLEGGCSVPVSVYTQLEGDQLTIDGGIFSLDGSQAMLDSVSISLAGEGGQASPDYVHIYGGEIPVCALKAAESAGVTLAQNLLKTEAADILAEAKKKTAEAILEEKKRKEAEAKASVET